MGGFSLQKLSFSSSAMRCIAELCRDWISEREYSEIDPIAEHPESKNQHQIDTRVALFLFIAV